MKPFAIWASKDEPEKIGIYEALRHLFSAAQQSSLLPAAQRDWSLNGCYTEGHDVMTEYVHNDGTLIRARSWGERDANGKFPNHTFSFSRQDPETEE